MTKKPTNVNANTKKSRNTTAKSAKNKSASNKKSTAPKAITKNDTTGTYGKVTEPLRSARTNSTNSKNATKPEKKKSRRFFFLGNNKEDSQVYQSVKTKKKPMFSNTTVGASTRGSIESDLIRFEIVWIIAYCFLVILLVRASLLQISNSQMYIDKGNQLITTVRNQPSYRGMITDRNNLPLAVSAPLSTVTFSPYDYALAYYALKKDIILTAKKPKLHQKNLERLKQMDLTKLATTSNVPLERLQKAVAIDDSIDVMDAEQVKNALPTGTGSHYFLLLNKATPEVADAVMELDFPGVYETQEFRRYYPQPQPNAQLLGFMGHDATDKDSQYAGRAGIEHQYEQHLAGEDGKVLVLKDARHNSLKELKQLQPEVAGKNVTLTIDSRLQYLLYKELEKVGRNQQALWSTGMIVDVHTGEVLALSTWPSFNNNKLSEMTGENQRNRAVLDAFEPGSVMKPFTVAAALDSGKYTKHSLIDTNPGVIRVKGYNIRDHGNLGSITMETLIQKSSNVGSVKLALALPPDAISSMQKRFGFGSQTALQLPFEQAGIVPTPKEREVSRRASISYGYGLQVTVAQLAQAYATLGAGGVRHPLTLVKTDKVAPAVKVIDRDKAMTIVDMMQAVTEEGGTGRAAAIDGYSVAGKTGTSRRTNPDGGYYKDQFRTVFAGVAPASNPRLAAVILVEDPRQDHYAGVVAAPVFHNVMKEALRLYNVPLDKALRTHQALSTQGSD